MHKLTQLTAWVLAAALPCLLSMPNLGVDEDLVNSIFGTGMADSARYGSVAEEWEEIPVTLMPTDDNCKPLKSPREDPNFMTIHEELKSIEVIKETGTAKCDYYRETQGFECVPYYQCGEDGTIITDGYGLIDIRFGGTESSPDLAILDSTDLMCPGSLDVCCKDPDFATSTAAPIVSTPSYGGGGEEDDSSEEQDGGYGGDKTDPGRDNDSSEEKTDEGEGGSGGYDGGDGRDDGDAVCVGDCNAPLFKPSCGRRNLYGLGVRVQNYKEGEAQFGEWPHICAVLKVQESSSGYGATEEIKIFTGGASLIAPGAALTGAHKVKEFENEPGQLLVRCGEWDTQTSSEPLQHQDRKVKQIITHPKYNKRNLGYTAAILILEEDFVLSNHIDTICLPEIDEVFDEESECFVKGWGKDKWEDGEYQVILKNVDLPMVPRSECQQELQKTRLGRRFRLDPSFVCAGGVEGKDACKGDGGGPLVCPMKNNPDRFVQVGVVAWGIGCGQPIPGVYTSVAHLGCWIDYVLKCNLGDKYELRYGQECQSWLSGPGNYMTSSPFACSVSWPVKDSFEEFPVESPNSSIPQKIQIEKTVPGYGK